MEELGILDQVLAFGVQVNEKGSLDTISTLVAGKDDFGGIGVVVKKQRRNEGNLGAGFEAFGYFLLKLQVERLIGEALLNSRHEVLSHSGNSPAQSVVDSFKPNNLAYWYWNLFTLQRNGRLRVKIQNHPRGYRAPFTVKRKSSPDSSRIYKVIANAEFPTVEVYKGNADPSPSIEARFRNSVAIKDQNFSFDHRNTPQIFSKKNLTIDSMIEVAKSILKEVQVNEKGEMTGKWTEFPSEGDFEWVDYEDKVAETTLTKASDQSQLFVGLSVITTSQKKWNFIPILGHSLQPVEKFYTDLYFKRISSNSEDDHLIRGRDLMREFHGVTVVTGDPGSGKSSFLKKCVLVQGEESSFPICVGLNDYFRDNKEHSLKAFVMFLLDKKWDEVSGLNYEYWSSADTRTFLGLDWSQTTLFLDGWDEITSSQQGEIITAIDNEWSDVTIIITSRVSAAIGPLIERGGSEFRIMLLQKWLVDEMIQKYCEIFGSEDAKLELQKNLVNELSYASPLYNLSTSPLMLSLLCRIASTSPGLIGKLKSEEAVLEAVVDRICIKDSQKTMGAGLLSSDLLMLYKIALKQTFREGSKLSSFSLRKDLIAKNLKKFESSNFGSSSFLIRYSDSLDLYSFSHSVIQSYFSAEGAIRLADKEFRILLDRHGMSWELSVEFRFISSMIRKRGLTKLESVLRFYWKEKLDSAKSCGLIYIFVGQQVESFGGESSESDTSEVVGQICRGLFENIEKDYWVGESMRILFSIASHSFGEWVSQAICDKKLWVLRLLFLGIVESNSKGKKFTFRTIGKSKRKLLSVLKRQGELDQNVKAMLLRINRFFERFSRHYSQSNLYLAFRGFSKIGGRNHFLYGANWLLGWIYNGVEFKGGVDDEGIAKLFGSRSTEDALQAARILVEPSWSGMEEPGIHAGYICGSAKVVEDCFLEELSRIKVDEFRVFLLGSLLCELDWTFVSGMFWVNILNILDDKKYEKCNDVMLGLLSTFSSGGWVQHVLPRVLYLGDENVKRGLAKLLSKSEYPAQEVYENFIDLDEFI